MAALEGGNRRFFYTFSPGIAAQFVAIIILCVTLPRLGINVKFIEGDDPEGFIKLIDEKTKAIYLESMGNPKFIIPDFEVICKVAHDENTGISWKNLLEQIWVWLKARAEILRDVGPCQNPFGSFLLLQGLEALSLRVHRQTENTLELARWLGSRDDVLYVS
ncbi:10108_t:CDS:2 [Funneliformis geosporum]|uniref:10108_t:CDS:1 n=1 Tax=Funneliformis geosporum TaxID=1117311 RepID=A0A9W4SE46_9GLOM|nr:10108_t:CDS:2 [Funneliformis geosporum]